MLFFPKHYTGGYGAIDVSYEPPSYPFEGKPGAFDFTRPNPAYFREYEDRAAGTGRAGHHRGHHPVPPLRLRPLGHRSGHGRGPGAVLFEVPDRPDRRLQKRVVEPGQRVRHQDACRIRGGLRVGWDVRDWDVIGEFIKARDPSGHPVSCHNIPFGRIYPDRPWMSHVSYQHPDNLRPDARAQGSVSQAGNRRRVPVRGQHAGRLGQLHRGTGAGAPTGGA